MDVSLTIIGFGEAGSSFAAAAGWNARARAHDINAVDYGEVVGCTDMAAAIDRSPVIISLVTADASVQAAIAVASHLAPGALFFDMNSVSPDSKRRASAAVTAAGGRYVDAAIMAPVNPQRMAVPILLSGEHADSGKITLAQLGFTNLRVVGDDIGRASTIKMLRSVMYKGVEALTAECLIACEAAGVTDEVMGSFGNDWSSGADYRLDRMMVHGQRRSAEMAEVAKTLSELGVEPLLTRGTIERQAQIGSMGIQQPPEGLSAKLQRLKP